MKRRPSTTSLNRPSEPRQQSDGEENKDKHMVDINGVFVEEIKPENFPRGDSGSSAELVNSDQEGKGGGWIRILRFLPMILVGCWLPATINRTYELFSRN